MTVQISVVIPVYNVEPFIYKCLNSLYTKSPQLVEVIVVDDGSTDDSLNEIRRFIDENSGIDIQVIHQDNKGLSEARNVGINLSTGNYIMFLDGDDWLADMAIDELIAMSTLTNEDVYVFDLNKVFTNFIVTVKGAAMSEFHTYSGTQVLKLMFGGKLLVSACVKLFKRDLLVRSNFQFPTGMWYEDLELTKLYILNPNATFQYLPKPYYQYLQRSNSITKTLNDKLFDKYVAFEKIKGWLGRVYDETEMNLLYQNFYLRAMVLEMVNSLSTAQLSEEYKKSTIKKIIALPISVEMRQGYFINSTLTLMQRLSLFVVFSFPQVYTFLFNLRYKIRPHINPYK
jgi:glycosyltransferase involved in cell wall biosynthesis